MSFWSVLQTKVDNDGLPLLGGLCIVAAVLTVVLYHPRVSRPVLRSWSTGSRCSANG